MEKGWGLPKPFTTCKWRRVGGPPTLHDLQMDKGWGPPNPSRLANGQRLGPPPTLHDLQMDKGWGLPNPSPLGAARSPNPCKWTRAPNPSWTTPPTLHDLQMDKGWGPPNPSRLANGQGLGALQPLTTWGGRAPNPSRLEAAEHSTLHDLGWGTPTPSPKIGKAVTGPFGPELPPTQNLNFALGVMFWFALAGQGLRAAQPFTT